MQYESIILELMTRIKKLEGEVAELKCRLPEAGDAAAPVALEEESGTTYQKLTDDMIARCYQAAKKIRDGANPADLADTISAETGMNRNSAVMYLYAVSAMLSGTIYKRAISARAMKIYFDTIFDEYGSMGLRRAVHATRLHVDYRHKCGHNVDSIEKLCDDYSARL